MEMIGLFKNKAPLSFAFLLRRENASNLYPIKSLTCAGCLVIDIFLVHHREQRYSRSSSRVVLSRYF